MAKQSFALCKGSHGMTTIANSGNRSFRPSGYATNRGFYPLSTDSIELHLDSYSILVQGLTVTVAELFTSDSAITPPLTFSQHE
jgi:hypothetical protein